MREKEKLEDMPERIVIDINNSSDSAIKELILWLMDRKNIEWSLEDYIHHENQRFRGEQ